MKIAAASVLLVFFFATCPAEESTAWRHLYVAVPGVRNDLKYGGHGLLVFDTQREDHRFVKRIPTHGVDDKGVAINVKGICASKELHCIYISTIKTLECIDLVSEKTLWEKPYPAGCDRMSISQDSKFIYLPTFEGDNWKVIDPRDGSIIAQVTPNSGAHNTLVSLDGTHAFLAGLKSHSLTIADCSTHTASGTITFSDNVRPLTMNGKGTFVYVCLNNLLGFEIGDVKAGKMIQRVEVPDFKTGKVLRHGCPSHGIAMTPDEKEIWVSDAFNKRLHIYDATAMPPKVLGNVELRDEPGWVTFSVDGKRAYPSTGDVVDVASRKVVAHLTDENGAAVQSEKLLEIEGSSKGGEIRIEKTGDQFGFGRLLN